LTAIDQIKLKLNELLLLYRNHRESFQEIEKIRFSDEIGSIVENDGLRDVTEHLAAGKLYVGLISRLPGYAFCV
jgi:hypothetical protein